MSKSRKITATLDSEWLADLDRLAALWECSREDVVTTAVLRFVNEEVGRLPPDPDDPLANLPPYVETDPLAIALNEAEQKAAEALDAYVKVGEDAADRGETISHEVMMRWFEDRVANRQRPAAAE